MLLPAVLPAPELPPAVAVWLEAFLAFTRLEENDDGVSEIEQQRIYALYEGARERVLTHRLHGHAEQAAAILVTIVELDTLMEGAVSLGGKLKVDDDERQVLLKVRDALRSLLRWHMHEGGGRLLPIAEWQGLVMKPQR